MKRQFAKAILAGCLLAGTASGLHGSGRCRRTRNTRSISSNGLIGNDWLQQMQRSAEVAVTKAPLAGRVDLHIETVENTAQAQINSLNNIIAAKPDAIVIHAASYDRHSIRRSKRPAPPASSSSASARW